MSKYDFLYVKLGNTWEAWEKDGRGNEGGFVLNWAAEGIGFGQLTFFKRGEETECYTECMSDEFVKAVIDYFFKEMKLTNK